MYRVNGTRRIPSPPARIIAALLGLTLPHSLRKVAQFCEQVGCHWSEAGSASGTRATSAPQLQMLCGNRRAAERNSRVKATFLSALISGGFYHLHVFLRERPTPLPGRQLYKDPRRPPDQEHRRLETSLHSSFERRAELLGRSRSASVAGFEALRDSPGALCDTEGRGPDRANDSRDRRSIGRWPSSPPFRGPEPRPARTRSSPKDRTR